MVRIGTTAVAALAVMALWSEPAAARAETWYYKGAEIRWQSFLGWRQVIRLREPLAHTEAGSAAPGSVLFTGWRYGSRLYGHARSFREGCSQPFLYKVRGVVSDDGTRAVLHGLSPVVENCRVVGHRAFGRDATLVLVKGD